MGWWEPPANGLAIRTRQLSVIVKSRGVRRRKFMLGREISLETLFFFIIFGDRKYQNFRKYAKENETKKWGTCLSHLVCNRDCKNLEH